MVLLTLYKIENKMNRLISCNAANGWFANAGWGFAHNFLTLWDCDIVSDIRSCLLYLSINW